MLPSLKPREVIKALKKAGFEAKEGAKHTILSRDGHPHIVVVPRHKSDLAKGTLRSIIAAAGLTSDEFMDLL